MISSENTIQKKLFRKSRDEWKDLLVNNAIYIVIFAIILFIVISEPSFVSVAVFRNILTQSSVRLILAFGVGGIIILQGTDLSLGRMVGFAAVVSGSLLQRADYANRFYPDMNALPLFVPILIAIAVCVVFSAINGFVVAKFHIHPFLATMGMMITLHGILSISFASGAPGPPPIGGFDTRYTDLVIGSTLGIPNLVIIAAVISVFIWILWNKTTFGKNMYAVGGNPEAAELSGISVKRITHVVFGSMGMLAALAGILFAARLQSATTTAGTLFELDAIAASFVGGVSAGGGVGTVIGSLIGALVMSSLTNGMNLMGIDISYQYIVRAIVLAAAVIFDVQTRKAE